MTLQEVRMILLLKENIYRLQRIKSQLTNCRIEYYFEMRSNRRMIGGAITLYRRVVRRLLKFLISPIVEQQNKVNQSLKDFCNMQLETTKGCAQIIYKQFPELADVLNSSAEQ